MTSEKKWVGLASISTVVDRRIGVHRVSGVVTPNSIAGLVQHARRDPSPVMVVSYVEAAIAIEPDKMFSYAWRSGEEAAPMEAPAALVVRPDQLALFRQYAQTALHSGILRAAFTSTDEARSWASEQAAVQEQWYRAYRQAIARGELPRKSSGGR